MVNHVDKLIEAGVTSFKIEGRVKSEYYVATVVKIYREAIDRYFEDPENFTPDPTWEDEHKKVSHRDYTTGFYFGKPGGTEQHYTSSSYIREYDLVGIVEDYDEKTQMATIVQKNRFFKGDTVEFLRPYGKFFTQNIEYMEDADGNELEVANKPQSIVKMKVDFPLEKDSMMRMEKKK